jgi:hypothetical protein
MYAYIQLGERLLARAATMRLCADIEQLGFWNAVIVTAIVQRRGWVEC